MTMKINHSSFLGTFKDLAVSLNNVKINSFDRDVSFLEDFTSDLKHLYFTGVGASFIPAQVGSHALSSMGVQASAAEALELLHGGFGRLKENDGIVCFSHSGTTVEIQRILKHARSMGVKTCLITGKKEWKSDAPADYILAYEIWENLETIRGVPSTSLLAQTCLSLSLVDLIGKAIGTQLDAKSHPNGTLGLINQKVANIMQPISDEYVGGMRSSLFEVVEKMSRNSHGVIFFVSKDGQVGIFTDGDLRRFVLKFLSEEISSLEFNPSDHVNFHPKVLKPEDSLLEASLMFESGKKVLVAPVLKNDKLVGIIHIHDLLERI